MKGRIPLGLRSISQAAPSLPLTADYLGFLHTALITERAVLYFFLLNTLACFNMFLTVWRLEETV